jgi:anti-anti-sigma factor
MSQPSPFEIRADNDGVLRLSGDLDSAAMELFADGSRVVPNRGPVVLDCSRLTFLDSSGIRAILKLAAECSAPVILRKPSPMVRRVLAISGVDELAELQIEGWADNPS